jgi:hypothetical protein
MSHTFRSLVGFAVCSALSFGAAQCKGEGQKPSEPPPYPALQWGASPAASVGALEKLGWKKTGGDGERITLILPEASELEVPADAAAAGVPERYQITLLAENDQLKIAALLRRDSSSNVSAFLRGVEQAYALGTPVWTRDLSAASSEAGNQNSEKIYLYERADAFVVAYESLFSAAETRIANDPNSQVEVRIYSRSNEGISREALIESLQNESR